MKSFVRVPVAVIELVMAGVLDATDVAVFVAIARRSRWRRESSEYGQAWISTRGVAKACGKRSASWASRAIRRLVAAGCVSVEARGSVSNRRSTLYRINWDKLLAETQAPTKTPAPPTTVEPKPSDFKTDSWTSSWSPARRKGNDEF